MYSGQVSKYKGGDEVSKQIAISEEIYETLCTLRSYRGRKFSFNTVIQGLIKESMIQTTNEELYKRMQWHAIQRMIKDLHSDGWVDDYKLQYSNVLRMLFSGQFKDAREYIEDQFPGNLQETRPKKLMP